MLSPSLEDYLEEIYRLSLSNGIVRVTDISQTLRVSLPSVTKALRRLLTHGYITHQKYGLIGLNEKGKQLGSFLVDRNQILQDFLALIRANCNIAAEAEAIEHYLSNSTIDCLKSLAFFMTSNPDVYQRYLDFVQCSTAQTAEGTKDENHPAPPSTD